MPAKKITLNQNITRTVNEIRVVAVMVRMAGKNPNVIIRYQMGDTEGGKFQRHFIKSLALSDNESKTFLDNLDSANYEQLTLNKVLEAFDGTIDDVV